MSPVDRERYSRQILFAPIGESGQLRLMEGHAAIVGVGALGSFHASAMARAGVGTLTIIDRDYIEPSNLQRQWLFDEADARQSLPKAVAAASALDRINSGVRVIAHTADLTPGNIDELLEGAQVILDGTDNFETRYLINDFCVQRRLPWIYGGAVGSYGITMPLMPGSACFRCIYPDLPGGIHPTCETAGILGPAASTVAALQVASAMKLLCGQAPAPRITTLDVWDGSLRQIAMPDRDPECPACGKGEFPYLDGERRAPVSLCGRNAVQIHERARAVDLEQLERRLAPHGEVRRNDFAIRFFLPPYEMTIFRDGRAIIKGTSDVGVARSLYARYLGS